MLTSDDVNTILKRLSLMRPNNRELEKEEHIIDRTDPNFISIK